MNAFDTSGPSQIAREGGFYLPGYLPKIEKPAPIRKPKAAKPEKKRQPQPVEAMRAHIAAGHTIAQTAEKFGMTEDAVRWHIGARAVDLRAPVNFNEVRAFIAQGGTAREAAAHFHISKETLYQRVGSVLEIRAKLPRTKKGAAKVADQECYFSVMGDKAREEITNRLSTGYAPDVTSLLSCESTGARGKIA